MTKTPKIRSARWHAIALSCLVVAASATVAAEASAQTCIQDVWKAHNNTQNLTCTANDVRIASASNVRDPVTDQPIEECVRGETFDFIADFRVVLGAQTRYDIGLYFATDGDPNDNGAISGTCSGSIDRGTTGPATTGFGFSPQFVQLDPAPDLCGDIDAAHSVQIITVRVDDALCEDFDGDGQVNLPNCTSWRTSGQNEVCQSINDAFPGSPSKCNCDITAEIPVIVLTNPAITTLLSSSEITVGKSVHDTAVLTGASPDAGGTVTYQYFTTSDCSGTPVFVDEVEVVNGVVPDSIDVLFTAATPGTPGTFQWQAVYSGDDHNNPATSACGTEPLVVTEPDITSAQEFDVIDCVTLTGLTSTAGGTVTFQLFDPAHPTCGSIEEAAFSSTVPVDFAVTDTYCTDQSFNVTTEGTWRWLVEYSGDDSNAALNLGCGVESFTITN